MQPTKTRTLRFPALANYINPTITDDVAYGRERTRIIETARRFAVSVSSGAISGTIAIAQAITLALEDAAIPFPADFDLESNPLSSFSRHSSPSARAHAARQQLRRTPCLHSFAPSPLLEGPTPSAIRACGGRMATRLLVGP